MHPNPIFSPSYFAKHNFFFIYCSFTNFRDEEVEPRMQKLLISRVLTEAFVELLEWDDYFGWPETLAMDAHRFMSLRDQLERAAMSTGVILLAFSTIRYRSYIT